ncbi:hypothetical protein K3495_g3423 [Podosphaera aphanis]|nr:hypothetical protein K3495_g3423 [Podosphaera aphanis]
MIVTLRGGASFAEDAAAVFLLGPVELLAVRFIFEIEIAMGPKRYACIAESETAFQDDAPNRLHKLHLNRMSFLI